MFWCTVSVITVFTVWLSLRYCLICMFWCTVVTVFTVWAWDTVWSLCFDVLLLQCFTVWLSLRYCLICVFWCTVVTVFTVWLSLRYCQICMFGCTLVTVFTVWLSLRYCLICVLMYCCYSVYSLTEPEILSDLYVLVYCCHSVYSLTEPDHPRTSTQLQTGELPSTHASPTKLNISAALGETAVTFTFGPPQELQAVKRPFQIPDDSALVTIWPVYVVKGNGEIMVTYTEVVSNRLVAWMKEDQLSCKTSLGEITRLGATTIICRWNIQFQQL